MYYSSLTIAFASIWLLSTALEIVLRVKDAEFEKLKSEEAKNKMKGKE